MKKDLFESLKEQKKQFVTETMSLQDYISGLKKDSGLYANAAERILKAIGEPRLVDTSKDAKLSRLFANKIIRLYDSFEEFYGLETTIDQIVSFFKHAAQGLEEKKQILYLLGPVGGGKSSLAEKLKRLIEEQPIYVLTAGEQMSPVFETPLGLFKKSDSDELGISERYLNQRLSPWAIKRLKEFDFDPTKFTVTKVYPSEAFQRAVSKTEPGDENTQDVTTLIGTVEIRKLGKFSEHDPDAYGYHGALNIANQGMLEFVEMFKAPIKLLNPLLTATQEGNYNGDKGIGSLPFEGIILAHSNESEWQAFRNDKTNEAFLDRVNIVKVPYTLRFSEEVHVYEKLIIHSGLKGYKAAPETLPLLAKFSVMTRLHEPNNADIYNKLMLYDGDNIKDEDPKAKSFEDYKLEAGINEGMSGLSTRLSYKVLSKVYNFDSKEIGANPIHLFHVLTLMLDNEGLSKEVQNKYVSYLNKLKDKYLVWLEKEISSSYIEAYSEYGQNLFDRYVMQADLWLQAKDYRDADTGELMNQTALNKELERIEQPADISNPRDFRQEISNFCLRYQVNHNGNNPSWTSYAKLKKVLEKQMFNKVEDMLPVIGYGKKETKDQEEKHDEFVKRMMNKGYTELQVKIICKWFMDNRRG